MLCQISLCTKKAVHLLTDMSQLSFPLSMSQCNARGSSNFLGFMSRLSQLRTLPSHNKTLDHTFPMCHGRMSNHMAAALRYRGAPWVRARAASSGTPLRVLKANRDWTHGRAWLGRLIFMEDTNWSFLGIAQLEVHIVTTQRRHH